MKSYPPGKVLPVKYAFPNTQWLPSKPLWGLTVLWKHFPVLYSCPPPCQSPPECPPGDGALRMEVSYVCSSCSSQNILFNLICLCVCVCVCVCVLNVCVCVYVFAANQEMPFYCWESKSSLTPTASSPLHTDPCLPLAPSVLLLSISPLVAQSSFVCLFLFSRYASLISSLGAFA